MKNTFPIYLLILPIFLFNILFTQDKKVKKQNKTSIIAKTNERNNFENNNSDEYLELFNQVYSKLEKSYVDSINSSDVILSGIKGMMSPLDPYTKILMGKSKESYEMLARGKYGGVGIQIGKRDKYLTVITPTENSPAKRAGILSGDKIVKIDSIETFSSVKPKSLNFN